MQQIEIAEGQLQFRDHLVFGTASTHHNLTAGSTTSCTNQKFANSSCFALWVYATMTMIVVTAVAPLSRLGVQHLIVGIIVILTTRITPTFGCAVYTRLLHSFEEVHKSVSQVGIQLEQPETARSMDTITTEEILVARKNAEAARNPLMARR
ncbi:hypothetical protein F5880DRAFT_396612 [Lentinula raphanica]|nr:hypothetical protein F5880DRAFT_396612 [Lentinula raphanica]